MRKRDYFLYHLTHTEFEDLVTDICKHWLGEGVGKFAEGKDGGRDARFNGTAAKYPSPNAPWDGKIVIQAKHTKTPNASCSDSDFLSYFKDKDRGERKKISRLIDEGLLTHYMVFTNRKLTGGTDEKVLKQIKSAGMQDAVIVGLEDIEQFLHDHPNVANDLPSNSFNKPFEFNTLEMAEVISGLHEAVPISGSKFESKTDFELINKKKKKNKINKMSSSYYQNVIINEFMSLFPSMKDFLENERNRDYRNIYHDIADEIRQKIIIHRDKFDFFEEIIVFLYDEITEKRQDLRGKRRYVTFILCYMYFDCDIGEREPLQ